MKGGKEVQAKRRKGAHRWRVWTGDSGKWKVLRTEERYYLEWVLMIA